MSLNIPKQSLFLLALAILLVIIVFINAIFLFPQKNSEDVPSTSTTPTTLPSDFIKRSSNGNSPIKPRAVSPKEDASGKIITNPSQKITYLLSEPINPNNIRVIVKPSIPVIIKQGNNQNSLLIYPDPPDYWHPNVLYVIKIFDRSNNLIDTYQIKVPRLKIEEIPAENEAWQKQ